MNPKKDLLMICGVIAGGLVLFFIVSAIMWGMPRYIEHESVKNFKNTVFEYDYVKKATAQYYIGGMLLKIYVKEEITEEQANNIFTIVKDWQEEKTAPVRDYWIFSIYYKNNIIYEFEYTENDWVNTA